MKKTEAKKIAIDKLHSILLMPSTWFDDFNCNIDGYTEEEHDLIMEQAYKVAERVIKQIVK